MREKNEDDLKKIKKIKTTSKKRKQNEEVSLSITDLLVSSIVTRQDSNHFPTFLFTIIDFILIPSVFNFSSISLISYESFQSAWQSAVTRILSTHTASLSFSKVPAAASFSKVSSDQNSSFRVSGLVWTNTVSLSLALDASAAGSASSSIISIASSGLEAVRA